MSQNSKSTFPFDPGIFAKKSVMYKYVWQTWHIKETKTRYPVKVLYYIITVEFKRGLKKNNKGKRKKMNRKKISTLSTTGGFQGVARLI